MMQIDTQETAVEPDQAIEPMKRARDAMEDDDYD
jgi:hypothetical protein